LLILFDKENSEPYLEESPMRFKDLVLLGIMIVVSLIYFFAGGFKGSKGAKIEDHLSRDAKAVSADKK
jgi:hypothetical protein